MPLFSFAFDEYFESHNSHFDQLHHITTPVHAMHHPRPIFRVLANRAVFCRQRCMRHFLKRSVVGIWAVVLTVCLLIVC